MAAVTHRVRLGCLLSATSVWPAEILTTLQKLSHGRTLVGVSSHGHAAALFTAGPKKETATGSIVEVESPDLLGQARDTHKEGWAASEGPPDRAAWSDAFGPSQAA